MSVPFQGFQRVLIGLTKGTFGWAKVSEENVRHEMA
jgi:hypothetical protein